VTAAPFPASRATARSPLLALAVLVAATSCAGPATDQPAEPVPGSVFADLSAPEEGSLASRFGLESVPTGSRGEELARAVAWGSDGSGGAAPRSGGNPWWQHGDDAGHESTQNVIIVNDRESNLASRPGDSRRVHWVDLDADRDKDFFALNYDMANEVFANVGEGGFRDMSQQGNALEATRKGKGAAFADIDSDGDLDAYIAVGNDLSNAFLRNLTNQGQTGLFADWPMTADADARHSYAAEFGDLDGDGDLDLVVANRYQPNDVYLQTGGTGTFTSSESGWSQVAVVGQALARVDDDRGADWKAAIRAGDDGDLVAEGPNINFNKAVWKPGVPVGFELHYDGLTGRVTFDLGNGATGRDVLTSTLALSQGKRPAGLAFRAWAEEGCHARFSRLQASRDGGPLLPMDDVQASGPAELRVARLLPAGGARSWEVTGQITFWWSEVQPDDDLSVAVEILEGAPEDDGGGGGDIDYVPAPASDLTTASAGSRDVELADLDGDGDLDILIANSTDEHNGVFINQGGRQDGDEGTFVVLEGDVLCSDGGKSFGIHATDLDSDGLMDVVVANRNQTNALYENRTKTKDETPTFRRVLGSILDEETDDSYDARFGDVDGDGDLDLVVVNRDQPNGVYLATGADPFKTPDRAWEKVREGDLVEDIGNSRSLALEDVWDYADPVLGRPIPHAAEVAMGNTGGEVNWIYKSYGAVWSSAGAGSAPQSASESAPESAAKAAAPGVQAAVARSAMRLTGHGATRPGDAPLIYLTGAPPLAVCGIVLSLEPAALPFKGNVLWADPNPPAGGIVAGFSTDANGGLSVRMTIPDDIGDLGPGIPVYLQVIVTDAEAAGGYSVSEALRGRIMPAR
jgi:hypothetical protein